MSPRTNLTIDRLVLHGFAPEQRDAVVAGFRAELARLLAAEGGGGAAFGASRAMSVLKVAPRGTDAGGAGEAAARQLLRGLQR